MQVKGAGAGGAISRVPRCLAVSGAVLLSRSFKQYTPRSFMPKQATGARSRRAVWSLFSGAMGLELGLMRALAAANGPTGAATIRANPWLPVTPEQVRPCGARESAHIRGSLDSRQCGDRRHQRRAFSPEWQRRPAPPPRRDRVDAAARLGAHEVRPGEETPCIAVVDRTRPGARGEAWGWHANGRARSAGRNDGCRRRFGGGRGSDGGCRPMAALGAGGRAGAPPLLSQRT